MVVVSGEAVPVEHDSSTSNNNNNTNVTSSTSDTSSSTGNPHSALPVITTAEPITIFHYEVMSVGDVQVARLTTQLLQASFCLIVVAILNFIWDLGRSSLTTTGAVWNLLTALALPACGFVGVRDKNITCIQYFCCCNYLCAFLTFVSLINAVVMLASSSSEEDSQTWYIVQLFLLTFFIAVYCRGGGLSQKLQEKPYFTTARTNPRGTYNVHQNTTEVNVQPVAQAVFVDDMSSSSTPPAAAGAADAFISSDSNHFSPQPIMVAGEVVSSPEQTQSPSFKYDSSSAYGDENASGAGAEMAVATAVAVPVQHGYTGNALERTL